MYKRDWFTLTEEEFLAEREHYKEYFDNWNFDVWLEKCPLSPLGTKFSF